MRRVFLCFAAAQLLLFVGTGVVGVARLESPPERHMLLGIFTLLLSCFIQVMVFTYFTVTGKMLGQALHLMKTDIHPLLESKRIKRGVTRLLAATVLSLLAVTITGAIQWRSNRFAEIHWTAVVVALAVHAGAYYVQYSSIVLNSRLLGEILDRYTAMRKRREAPDNISRPNVTALQESANTP